jgi:hypothetical protein
MVLRRSLGEYAWLNRAPRACFLIDDPLLRRRYGFLDYAKLLEAASRQEFSCCVAFIPWNYRRSNRRMAKLFSTHGGMSLCVHGCDHTNAEFETANVSELRSKARMALSRMRGHQRAYGVPFDDVMVFPQGLFSEKAMTALKAEGYLAAINTSVYPSSPASPIQLRDLLDVAVTKFSGFPLFSRRYPRNLAEFAFDLFMGKPALIVEHHGYFQRGCAALESFVAHLNAIEEHLEWSSPADICSRACVTRKAADGLVHVRFYTDRFGLKNDHAETQSYLLYQHLDPQATLPTVTVEGRAWESEREGNSVKICLSLDPGQTAEIRILPEAVPVAPSWRPDGAYKARVLMRRLLSEVRDNYVDTNRTLRQLMGSASSVHAQYRLSRHGAVQASAMDCDGS